MSADYVPSYCRGCGVPLQTRDPESPGYVPPEKLGQPEVRCRRCFRLLHYKQDQEPRQAYEAQLQAVSRGVEEADLVLQVFDVADFEGSLHPDIEPLVVSRPVLAVGTRTDLLPRQTRPDEIESWIERRLEALGRPPRQVLAVSGQKNWGLKRLEERLRALASGTEKVAVVGAANVGKSTLLNALGQRLAKQKSKDPKGRASLPELTASPRPGTTQGLVRTDLGFPGLVLLDTPGLLHPGRVSDQLCPECGARAFSGERLARKTFKLEPGQALLWGALASCVIRQGPRPVVLAFAAPGIALHRTREQRLQDLLSHPEKSGLAPPPCQDCRDFPLTSRTIQLEDGQDLAFPGLGWLAVRRGPAVLEVQYPEGIEAVVRPSLVAPPEQREQGGGSA